jgi:hypothetical protein
MGRVVNEQVTLESAPLGARGSSLVAGIGDRLSSRRAILGEAAIVSNSNGIDVVRVSATAGRRSRLGITVLWPPRQLLKRAGLDSSAAQASLR